MVAIKNEKDVMDALRVDSLENLPREKVAELVQLIPSMDHELAVQLVQDILDCRDAARSIIDLLNDNCEMVLQSCENCRKDAVKGYQTILDEYRKLMDSDISYEQKLEIAEKMVYIADRLAEINEYFANLADLQSERSHDTARFVLWLIIAGASGIFGFGIGRKTRR